MSEWKKCTFKKIAIVNPKEQLAKGTKSKKIPMEALVPFRKKIPYYQIESYNGGTKFRNGDTIIARITPSLENGKTSFVDILKNNEIGFGSTEYIVIREIENISDKHFLYYLSISPNFREIAIKSMTGSSGRQRVQNDVILNHFFSLPPLKEQKAIAEVLSSLDDKIDLLRRQNKTLENLAQTLFRQYFIKEANDEWEEKSLSEIADFLNGLACQKFPPKNGKDKLHVLKIKELKEGISDNSDWVTSDVKPEYIVKNGDIIFAWSASLIVKIWDGEDCILNQHLFKVTSKNYPKWFYYQWCKYHLNKFISIAQAHATTMGHIKRKDLDNAMCLVPSIDKLKNFDTMMSKLLKKQEVNARQIKTLENLRDTLLPKLMSGKEKILNG